MYLVLIATGSNTQRNASIFAVSQKTNLCHKRTVTVNLMVYVYASFSQDKQLAGVKLTRKVLINSI